MMLDLSVKFEWNRCILSRVKISIKSYYSVTNNQNLSGDNPSLDLVNWWKYIYLWSRYWADINNQGPYICYKFAKNDRLLSQPRSCQYKYSYMYKNSKWVWSGNTTTTNCRQPRGTARKSRSTITRHQEDKLSKAISSLFPIKMIAILEWT